MESIVSRGSFCAFMYGGEREYFVHVYEIQLLSVYTEEFTEAGSLSV